jgi:hypothetical protein
VPIRRTCQVAGPVSPPEASVVARDQARCTRDLGHLQQVAELEVFVTGDARVRSSAATVLVHEKVHDGFLEPSSAVEDVEGDLEGSRDPARILDCLGGAAAVADASTRLTPEVEHHAGYGVPLFQHQRSSYRAVHPTAHGDDDSFSIGHGGTRDCLLDGKGRRPQVSQSLPKRALLR